MNSVTFPQVNHTFQRPENMSDGECGSLPVHVTPMDLGAGRIYTSITSCWEPTPEERKAIAEGGKIWLTVLGPAQPPVMVRGIDPFSKSGLPA